MGGGCSELRMPDQKIAQWCLLVIESYKSKIKVASNTENKREGKIKWEEDV